MDDGEVELSDPVLLPNCSSSNTTAQGSTSVESMIDELFKHTRTCTHTHTCNQPGPDTAHTHTCYHTHTQVFSSGEDTTKTHSDNPSLRPRKPLSNREAVRKYREKKKAHTAYLEEEVKKLRLFNQQLVRKLQKQAILEAEILRLRTLLFDLRGKIDTELGSFPFQKLCSFKEGDCGMNSGGSIEAIGLQCQAELSCFQPASVDCRVTGNRLESEAAETMVSNKNQCQ